MPECGMCNLQSRAATLCLESCTAGGGATLARVTNEFKTEKQIRGRPPGH